MSNKDNGITSFEIESLIEYPVVHTPNTKFKPEGEFKVTLVLDTEEKVNEVKSLFKSLKVSETVFNPSTEELMPRLKLREDGSHTFDLKRPGVNSKGMPATITVVDAKNNDIPKNILIGNGSRAVVKGFAYTNPKGKTSLRLSGIQVLDLVPYTSGNKATFTPRKDGFTVSSQGTNNSDGELDLESLY